jgi:hypothetical protein
MLVEQAGEEEEEEERIMRIIYSYSMILEAQACL